MLTQRGLMGNLKGWLTAAAPFLLKVRLYSLAKTEEAPARAFALAAAKVAQDRHCTDIVVLDLRGLSPVTDYFVIATGTSDRQIRTVAEEITCVGMQTDFSLFGRAGYDQARWILLDFVDVVVHIFDTEYREYYDLELLWGDAPRIDY